MAATQKRNTIDELMDRASEALVATEYFRAEDLAMRGLLKARAAHDYERMARICLPLQEARRQRRHEAMDSGLRMVLPDLPKGRSIIEPGMYLVQPPLLGIDARTFRELAHGKKVPVVVVCREPMTRAGLWPVVAVNPKGLVDSVTLRTRIAPPEGVKPKETGINKDEMPGTPSPEWFLAANEQLGDAAIASLKKDDPPAWRVDDLLDALEALPDHEKLHQKLADECRAAMLVPVPTERRRGRMDDPRGF